MQRSVMVPGPLSTARASTFRKAASSPYGSARGRLPVKDPTFLRPFRRGFIEPLVPGRISVRGQGTSPILPPIAAIVVCFFRIMPLLPDRTVFEIRRLRVLLGPAGLGDSIFRRRVGRYLERWSNSLILLPRLPAKLCARQRQRRAALAARSAIEPQVPLLLLDEAAFRPGMRSFAIRKCQELCPGYPGGSFPAVHHGLRSPTTSAWR